MRPLPTPLSLAALAVAVAGCASAAPSATNAVGAAAQDSAPFHWTDPSGARTTSPEPDHDYALVVVQVPRRADGPSNGADTRIYLFSARDGQSTATLALGPLPFPRTEQSIAAQYDGAVVTKVPGVVAGRTVECWHYKDRLHLYSTCQAPLPAGKGRDLPVTVDLIANSPERLAALEAAFSRIQLD